MFDQSTVYDGVEKFCDILKLKLSLKLILFPLLIWRRWSGILMQLTVIGKWQTENKDNLEKIRRKKKIFREMRRVGSKKINSIERILDSLDSFPFVPVFESSFSSSITTSTHPMTIRVRFSYQKCHKLEEANTHDHFKMFPKWWEWCYWYGWSLYSLWYSFSASKIHCWPCSALGELAFGYSEKFVD